MGHCQNCGAELIEGIKYCTVCGAPANLKKEIPDSYASPNGYYKTTGPYTMNDGMHYPDHVTSYQKYGVPVPPPYPPQDFQLRSQQAEPSFEQWLLWTFLALIPFANIIILCIWSFADDTLSVKKKWARAMLICMSVLTAIMIISFIARQISSMFYYYY